MSSLNWWLPIIFFEGIIACDEPEKHTQDTTELDAGEQSSAYGTCSLELVAASGFSFSASTIGASTVEIHLVFADDDHGEQVEEHPLLLNAEGQSSLSWSLDLEGVSDPTDVVLGQSTLWTASVFDPVDKVFVARDDNNEICDCWDVSSEYGQIDCEGYGAE